MAETIEKVEQAENTKVESTDNPIDDKHEQTESVSIADKNEFLQNFIKDNDDNDTQSIEEAKIKDKISMLEAKIQDIKATKSSQNDTIQACKTVIDSDTYPKLNPIISSFSAHLEKLDKKKDKKIVKKENQLKKAQRKLVKLQRKQKRSKLLKNFISAMVHSSSNKQQEAYINAMQALKEDSLGRADRQLDKANSKLDKLNEKLNGSTVSEVDKLKINARIKKVESKRDMLIARINNLNELEQELNKLTKIELVDDKIDELRNTAVETAEKAAMNGSSVSETIDNVAETSSEVIKEVLEPDKIKESENDMTEEQNKQTDKQEESKQAEVETQTSKKEEKGEDKQQTNFADQEQKTEDKPQEKKTQANSNNFLKKTGLTQKQLLAILNTGIAIKVAETIPDKEYTIAFTKENKEKINQVLEAVNTQVQGKHMMR